MVHRDAYHLVACNYFLLVGAVDDICAGAIVLGSGAAYTTTQDCSIGYNTIYACQCPLVLRDENAWSGVDAFPLDNILQNNFIEADSNSPSFIYIQYFTHTNSVVVYDWQNTYVRNNLFYNYGSSPVPLIRAYVQNGPSVAIGTADWLDNINLPVNENIPYPQFNPVSLVSGSWVSLGIGPGDASSPGEAQEAAGDQTYWNAVFAAYGFSTIDIDGPKAYRNDIGCYEVP